MHFAALDVGEEAAMTPTLRSSDRQIGALKREQVGWVVERPDAAGNMVPTCTSSPKRDEVRIGSYKRQKVVAYIVARRVEGAPQEDVSAFTPSRPNGPADVPTEELDALPGDGIRGVDLVDDLGAHSHDDFFDDLPGGSDAGSASPGPPMPSLQKPSASSKRARVSKSLEPGAQVARAKGVKIFVKGRGEVKRQHVADVLRLCLGNLSFGESYHLTGGSGLTRTPRITYQDDLHLKNYGEFYKHVMENHEIDLVETLHHHPERVLDVATLDRNFFR